MIFKKMFALLPRLTSTTIATRMNLLVIGGLIAMMIMGGFNYYSGKVNSEALNKVYEINVQAVNHLQKIDNILKDMRYRMAAILIGNTTFDISRRHLETSKIELEREFNELKALPLETDTEKVLMEEMIEGWKEVVGKIKTLEEAYVNKDKDDLADISNIGWSNLHKNFIRPLSDLLPIKEKAMKNLYDKSNDTNQVLFLTSIALSIISAIGAFLMLYWVKLSITRSLREATDISNKVAQGDLTTEINITNEDELGKLLQQLNKMQTSLRDIVSEVRIVSDDIHKTSMQLSDGNNKLSTRTEEQASSLEETAASMEELTSTVGQNAENATKANRLAQKASQVAHDGEVAMHQVIKTIGEVNQSSSKIVDIVSVIDNIAFQTNILALNAAVEAARAGEQGRGFAVVASEVRSLAQKAAVAAKEIKALIENSVSKIQQGNKMVDNAGKTMNEIIISISEVTKIMQDIASASVEQSNGIAQVNKTITQLDHVTQENAALVGEAAAAAESMTERAKQLNLAMDSFKID